MRLSEALNFYNLYLRLNRSEATQTMYNSILRKLHGELEDVDISNIAPHDIDKALLGVLCPDMADATQAKYKRTVRTFFNWLVKRRYLERSPVTYTVKNITPNPLFLGKTIPEEDIDKMLASAVHPRDYALVRLLADMGVRRGAVHKLKVDCVRLDEQILVAEEKQDKWHIVPLPDKTCQSLATWLDERASIVGPEDHGFVFVRLDSGAPLKYDSIKEILRRIAARAGVKKYNAHGFRHALGIWAARVGVPVTEAQAILGHSRASTTWDFYYKSDPERLRDTMNRRADR